MASMLAAALSTASPLGPSSALAQQAADEAGKNPPSQLPPLRPIVVTTERKPISILAGGIGAAVGIIVVDAIVGGLLLPPLGLPSGAVILGLAGAAAEAPAAAAAAPVAAAAGAAPAVAAVRAALPAVVPSFTVAERLFAVVGSIASGVGGGYLGTWLVRPTPDFVGLSE
jgi:hypothetical protein